MKAVIQLVSKASVTVEQKEKERSDPVMSFYSAWQRETRKRS